MNISPLPWKRDEFNNVCDATGERVVLTGCAMKTENARPDHVCHGNTALLLAAPALLTFYRASRKFQMVGHPEATVQDERNAEAAFEAASIAADEAVRALNKQELTT